MAVDIKTFFDPDTATFTHVVTDPATKKTAVIDSVLDYDQYSGRTSTHSVDRVIQYLKAHDLTVEWILDTHIHADHITGSHYLQQELGQGKIGIGAKIKDVLQLWIPIFNSKNDTNLDGTQFDHLFTDGEVVKLGEVDITVWHTPGHTPACASYLIEDAIFVGDTMFMPDIGTARTDFPGGSALDMYHSVRKILGLDEQTRIFLCHDYPPEGREVMWMSTVKEQKETNVLVNAQVTKEKYVSMRHQRDKGKAVPKLLLPSIQANLRAGHFGTPEDNGVRYVKIPVDKI